MSLHRGNVNDNNYSTVKEECAEIFGDFGPEVIKAPKIPIYHSYMRILYKIEISKQEIKRQRTAVRTPSIYFQHVCLGFPTYWSATYSVLFHPCRLFLHRVSFRECSQTQLPVTEYFEARRSAVLFTLLEP